MSLALEGAAHAIGSTVSSYYVPVSTSGTNRIIVLCAHYTNKSANDFKITGVTGGGLSWALRKQFQFAEAGSNTQYIEIWWAYASAQLTAQNITATFSGAIDDSSLQIFAVSGVDSSKFTNPWDSNVSLTATYSPGASSVLEKITGVSTTSTASLLFYFIGYGDNGLVVNAASPFADIGNTSNGGGTYYSYTNAGYEVVAAPQSSITITPTPGYTYPYWGMVADAISGDTGGGGSETGTLATTEAPDVFAATGEDGHAGTLATTEAPDVFAAVGNVGKTGTLATTEAPDIVEFYSIHPRRIFICC